MGIGTLCGDSMAITLKPGSEAACDVAFVIFFRRNGGPPLALCSRRQRFLHWHLGPEGSMVLRVKTQKW
jgi:hypothetical protein